MKTLIAALLLISASLWQSTVAPKTTVIPKTTILSSSGGGASAWTHQSPTCGAADLSGSAASIACTYSSQPTVGWWSVCWVSGYVNQTYSVTDNGSTPNTYTALISISPASSPYMVAFLAHITNLPGAGTLQVTGSGTSGSGFYPAVTCDTASDTGSSPALDSSSSSPCVATATGAAALTCFTSLTPSAIDWVSACTGYSGGGTFSAGGGMTAGAAASPSAWNEYLFTSSITTPASTSSSNFSVGSLVGVAIQP